MRTGPGLVHGALGASGSLTPGFDAPRLHLVLATAPEVDIAPVPLQVVVQEPGSGEAGEFYLLARRSAASEPVDTLFARRIDAAVEEFLLPGLSATAPYPPWRAGRPVAPEWVLPPMRLAVTREGREYVIGRVDWPSGCEKTHGELRQLFHAREWAEFRAIWARLRRPV